MNVIHTHTLTNARTHAHVLANTAESLYYVFDGKLSGNLCAQPTVECTSLQTEVSTQELGEERQIH